MDNGIACAGSAADRIAADVPSAEEKQKKADGTLCEGKQAIAKGMPFASEDAK